jgi:hypothetical protein
MRLNLICGMSLFCENNCPITQLFLFTNGKIMPSMNSPNPVVPIIMTNYVYIILVLDHLEGEFGRLAFTCLSKKCNSFMP